MTGKKGFFSRLLGKQKESAAEAGKGKNSAHAETSEQPQVAGVPQNPSSHTPPGTTQLAGSNLDKTQNVQPPKDSTQLVSSTKYSPDAIQMAEESVNRGAAEADVLREWKIGDTILDTYEVKPVLEHGQEVDCHTAGGMGKVYRVHHRDWVLDMALKVPRPERFRTQEQKADFVRECHTWMDLGLHLHIVTCHHVRVLGGVPCVFAEYVEGGSLLSWIKEGKLYKGEHKKALERILDISIQFARGLHYAHEKGLIHQDVKPANVMIAVEGGAEDSKHMVVKVSDFGLAKARAAIEGKAGPGPQGNISATYGGRTEAYCSPEQADIEARRDSGIPRAQWPKLTIKTDMWSWAVSVFEMFAGMPPCAHGQVAGEIFKSFLETGAENNQIPSIPESLAKLLQHCFQEKPDDRPKDLAKVSKALEQIYLEKTGNNYPHETPTPPTELADVLNNKAVSFLELGMKSESERLWQEALKVDPHHPEGTYNLGLRQWRKGKIKDTDLLTLLKEVQVTHTGDWVDEYLLGLVHLERGDGKAAAQILEKAARRAGKNSSVALALAKARAVLPTLIRTFHGHWLAVLSVAFSRDSYRALSGSSDKTLRLWDVETGKCLRTFKDHIGAVSSVAFSSDGQWALSGSGEETTLRLWGVETGRCFRISKGPMGGVMSVVFSPDSRRALTGYGDGRVRLWDLSTGRCISILEGHTDHVRSVAFSPDGCRALSASDDRTLRLWDVKTGQCMRTFAGHTDGVCYVAFSSDGLRALSGSKDNMFRLWDIQTGRCLRTFEEQNGQTYSVAFSPDGSRALSSSSDETLRLWEVETGRCLRTFEEQIGPVYSLVFSPDGRRVLLAGNSKIHLWQIESVSHQTYELCRPISSQAAGLSDRRVAQLKTEAESALAVEDFPRAYAEIIRALAIPSHKRVHDLLKLKNTVGLMGRRRKLDAAWRIKTLAGHMGPVIAVAFSANGYRALSGSRDKTLRLWNLETGKCLMTIECDTTELQSVAFSPDGRRALSGSDDPLQMWDVETGQCLKTFSRGTCGFQRIAFSPDGLWVLAVTKDGFLELWDIEAGRCLRTFDRDMYGAECLAFSPDGLRALSGGRDRFLQLWNIKTGRLLRKFENHTDYIESVAFSPDGCWVASGSRDKTFKLWDIKNGQCLRTFKGHADGIESVTFHPDGRWILSGSKDHTLLLRETETGRHLRTFEGHTNGIKSVAFSRDGLFLLSGSDDKTIGVWQLDWDYEFPDRAAWDKGARPYLVNFITMHTPYAAQLPPDRDPTKEEITLALTRQGRPTWTDTDFNQLLYTLGCAGYGWLRPEGVKRRLEKMAAK